MDTFIRLIEAVVKLLGALAWPAVALIVLWWFRDALRQLFSNISEGSFKAFGIEGSAKLAKIQEAIVSADLSKQNPKRAENINLSQSVGKSLRAADYAAGLLITHRDVTKRRLLWVDDTPTNNVLEAKAIEELGFQVDFAISTDDALADIAKRHYDAIITDKNRPKDPEASKTLIRNLRTKGVETPVIVYCADDTPEFEAEMKDTGAYAVTHLASELVRRVAEAVGRDSDWRKFQNRVRHLRSSS